MKPYEEGRVLYLHTLHVQRAFTCVRRKVNKFSPSYSYRIIVRPSLSSSRAPFHTRTHSLTCPWGGSLKLLSGFRLARPPRRAAYTVVNLAPCKIGHYCPYCVHQCAQGSTYVTARECIQFRTGRAAPPPG